MMAQSLLQFCGHSFVVKTWLDGRAKGFYPGCREEFAGVLRPIAKGAAGGAVYAIGFGFFFGRAETSGAGGRFIQARRKGAFAGGARGISAGESRPRNHGTSGTVCKNLEGAGGQSYGVPVHRDGVPT